MGKAETRKRLLQAATQVIDRDGPGRLTLDAVAAEAGASKGGVLYHFASKKALLRGMLEDLCQSFNTAWEERLATSSDDAAVLKAFVEASASLVPSHNRASAGLMAALANEPDLMAEAAEEFKQIQDRLEQHVQDPVLATIVRLAADGLWYAEWLHFAPPDGPRREAVVARLLQMAEEAGSAKEH